LATDGLGVGSFEYGWLRENVLSANVVLPGGRRRDMSGEEMGSFLAPEGTGGIVVGARLRTRRADADVPFAASFEDAGDLAGTLASLVEAKVPLWHLAFVNAAMARARHLGETSLIFGAYPGERAGDIEDELRRAIESYRGRLLAAANAYRVWGERFFPVKPSGSPPDLPGLSREFASPSELPGRLEGADSRAADVAVQGTVARSGQILLLTLDARDMA
jgi:FAD/FMN-containing dehydrogenase